MSDGHAHYRQRPGEYLSSEYLFCKAAQRQHPITHYDGVRTDAIASALTLDGQPLEQHYPYQSLEQNAALVHPADPFPYDCFRAGWVYETFSEAHLASLLRDGRSVVIAMTLTKTFYDVTPERAVVEPGQAEDVVLGTHAVVGVGYGQNKAGAGYVKIRNSWGALWGDGGYAWVTMGYANRHVKWMARFSGINS